MAKIKVKDQEFEVPDEVASLVADETGVPYRNRAAESRRKQEKYEKELEDLRAKASTPPPAPVRQPVQAPYNPGYYQVPAGYVAPQGMTADEAREIAREEARRAREQDEYRAEQARLQEEWASFEDEKHSAQEYLRSKGYADEQIANFGPRDWRLVRDALESKKSKPTPKRTPQEVVLDTSGSGGVEDIVDGPYTEDKIRAWDSAKLREEIRKAKARPALGDE